MDDKLAKSKQGHSHLEDLSEIFATLSQYELKLNPTKYTFSVKSGKFLRFMISERGIEVSPHKIEAILALAEPRCREMYVILQSTKTF